MSRLNLAHALNEFDKRVGQRVFAQVHDGISLTKDIAKVVVVMSSLDHHREDMELAIAAALDNLARPISGSFRVVGSASRPTLVGYVAANREVREVKDLGGFRAMAANIVMDNQDQTLWEVKSDGSGNRFITRHATEDLSELLVTASVTTTGTPSLRCLASVASTREYLTFVDVEKACVDFGYVIEASADKLSVLTKAGTTVDVGRDFVIQASNLKTSDIDFAKGRGKTVAAPATSGKEALKSYYAKLYKDIGPDFYAQLEQIIDNSAIV